MEHPPGPHLQVGQVLDLDAAVGEVAAEVVAVVGMDMTVDMRFAVAVFGEDSWLGAHNSSAHT